MSVASHWRADFFTSHRTHAALWRVSYATFRTRPETRADIIVCVPQSNNRLRQKHRIRATLSFLFWGELHIVYVTLWFRLIIKKGKNRNKNNITPFMCFILSPFALYLLLLSKSQSDQHHQNKKSCKKTWVMTLAPFISQLDWKWLMAAAAEQVPAGAAG